MAATRGRKQKSSRCLVVPCMRESDSEVRDKQERRRVVSGIMRGLNKGALHNLLQQNLHLFYFFLIIITGLTLKKYCLYGFSLLFPANHVFQRIS